MNCPKPVGWVLAGTLVLGLAAGGGPALFSALAQPPESISAQVQPLPGKALAEQLALSRLTALGMNPSQALSLWANLDPDRQRDLMAFSGPPAWLDYLAFDFAWLERLERYEAFHIRRPNLSAEDVVVQVNIGLDMPPYENPEAVENPESLTALVNQYHALPADYVPELVSLEAAYTNQQDRLRPEAYRAFVRMADAAAQEGLRLYNASAYRSYQTQRWVYQRYVQQEGMEAADTYSARPGHSEHQTGLALDINTASLDDHFEESREYAWLLENSWRFGFLLRFPEGKEALTGYQFEPWHYRYVGRQAAKVCWEEGWTLEEYTARLPAADRTGS